MSKGQSYEQLVGSYLDNEMSGQERLDFESNLQNNAELRKELDFQQHIIEGIKESRRLELKARLDNIPIYTPLYQTVAFKAVAVVALTASIGFGTYFLLQKNDNFPSQIALTNDQDVTVEEIVPAIPEAIISAEDADTATLTPSSSDKSAETRNQRKKQTTVSASTAAPKVVTPKVDTFEEEDVMTEEVTSIENINPKSVTEPAVGAVEVATVKDKKNKFHYKFYDNQLYLLGSFDEMPYEIIEINSQSGKKFFLFYKDSFYRLENDQVKPTPLEKIENDSLVNELKIIQLNKNH